MLSRFRVMTATFMVAGAALLIPVAPAFAASTACDGTVCNASGNQSSGEGGIARGEGGIVRGEGGIARGEGGIVRGEGGIARVKSCVEVVVSTMPAPPGKVWVERSCVDSSTGIGGALYNLRDIGYLPPVGGSGGVGRQAAPVVDVRAVAQGIVNSLDVDDPQIGIAPNPGKEGLIGLPVWMWLKNPSSWNSRTVTESRQGVTVTATIKARKIVWGMGDGNSITCTNPGTPYSGQAQASPNCGHHYGKPGTYTVSATTTYDIDWNAGGFGDTLTLQRSSSVNNIGMTQEQVLNRK